MAKFNKAATLRKINLLAEIRSKTEENYRLHSGCLFPGRELSMAGKGVYEVKSCALFGPAHRQHGMTSPYLAAAYNERVKIKEGIDLLARHIENNLEWIAKVCKNPKAAKDVAEIYAENNAILAGRAEFERDMLTYGTELAKQDEPKQQQTRKSRSL